MVALAPWAIPEDERSQSDPQPPEASGRRRTRQGAL